MTDKAKLYAVKNDEGEWMSLDGTQTGIWYSNNPTLFKDKSYAEAQSMGRRTHVVELVEAPEKVVVNEKEASLLEKMADGTNFNGERGFEPGLVITNFVLNNPVHGESHFETEDRLMRAYVNGWTVEKPKRWSVKVPHSRFYYWKWKDDEIGVGSGEDDDVRGVEPYRFTDAEIEHYGLQYCEKEEATDDEQ
jgi:hypothetical protein